jgi:HlyD family type I secretion membrane fusion protein
MSVVSQTPASLPSLWARTFAATRSFFTADVPAGQLDDGARGPSRLGLVVIVAFFGIFGLWAATAKLESAVIAPGVVEVEGNRKVLQHPDGGVVRAIMVKEGDFVHQGQSLIQLDTLQIRAGRDIALALVTSLRAQEARLIAERDGATDVTFPADLMARASDPSVASAMKSQQELFATRRDALVEKNKVLHEQIAQAGSAEQGMHGEVSALEQQRQLIMDELDSTQKLYEKGYATKTRVLALQRSAAALEGQRLEYTGNASKMQHGAAESEAQILQLQQDWLTDVSGQLTDVQDKLVDASERLRAIQAVLDDTDIRAPATGRVIGLSVHTVGGVIAKGERILEIVPTGGPQIITANISTVDAEHVWAGMETDIRLVAAKTSMPPLLRGRVTRRSPDRIVDERTGQAFYSVQIAIDQGELAKLHDLSLSPGMPVEVIVPTGARTALGYLFEPLENSFQYGMKEQ